MIKGAIFDMDGTLLDSMPIWDNMAETYMRSIGCEPKPGLSEIVNSMSLYQSACYCKAEYGIAKSADEIMDEVNAMVEKYYKYKLLPKSGVQSFLQNLKNHGVKMCVATVTDSYLADAALERCGIRKYFSEIFTCNSVGHGKDEPYIYIEAMKHLGTNRYDTVIFEDALYAVKTVKKEGFIAAAVYDASEHKQAELERLADIYITDFEDFDTFWKFASVI